MNPELADSQRPDNIRLVNGLGPLVGGDRSRGLFWEGAVYSMPLLNSKALYHHRVYNNIQSTTPINRSQRCVGFYLPGIP